MGNARWICQWSPSRCDGTRYVKGRFDPCPLAYRCLDPAYRITPYEFPGQRKDGNLLELIDPEHRRRHQSRSRALIRVFDPERYRKQLARKRELYHRHQARKAAQRKMEQAIRELEVSSKMKMRAVITLPCGEDCANCPYDGCRYTDADADAIFAEELAKKKEKQAEKKKAWREENRDHVNALERARAARNPAVAENKREWYLRNREQQLTKQNDRYRTDPAFRQAKLEASRRRYAEKKDEINRRRREVSAEKRDEINRKQRERRAAQRALLQGLA